VAASEESRNGHWEYDLENLPPSSKAQRSCNPLLEPEKHALAAGRKTCPQGRISYQKKIKFRDLIKKVVVRVWEGRYGENQIGKKKDFLRTERENH